MEADNASKSLHSSIYIIDIIIFSAWQEVFLMSTEQ